MPFDPATAFFPADPSQWWRTRALPPTLVQPNAPPNRASGNAAGADGIDDWIVPGQASNPTDHPNEGVAPASAGSDPYPDDWIYPDGWNAPPAASPGTAPPAPSPQPDAANPGISNRPAPPPDPLAAYWALIPASSAGAMAWHPPIFLPPNPFSPENIPASAWVTPLPIFLNSPGQFPLPAPAPRDVWPPAAAHGLLGGIGKMLAARATANDPWDAAANGLLGGIAKLIAASASPDPLSIAGSRGLLGALANLQPATSNAQADASYLPRSRPFMSPDPIGYQGGSPPHTYLRNDLLNRADPTGPAPDQPPTDETFGAAPDTGRENASPNVLLVAGEENEKEHNKPDPAVFSGLTDKGLTTSPKALPTLPPLLPFFPRPLLPPTSVPQPPPRAAPLPASSTPPPAPPQVLPPQQPPPSALSSPPSRPAAKGPTLYGTPIGLEPFVPPTEPSDAGDGSKLELPAGIGPGPFAGEPTPAGPGKRPSIRQQVQINASGDKYGCHTCGAKKPGTPLGNWIGDHQAATALNPPGQLQYFLPHCLSCSLRQGGLVRNFMRRRGK
jgi:hypothetical protein